MSKTILSTALLMGLALLALAGTADAPSPVPAAVAKMGRINGTAQACDYPDLAVRAKGVVLTRIAKTFGLGDVFDDAGRAALQERAADLAGCPSRAALAGELDAATLRLTAPATHKFDQDKDAPEVGVNPRYLLQAANGRAIMDSDFPKHFQLITFGYTSCPDTCPTTLMEMTDVLKRLDDKASEVRAFFISLDPSRDTLPVLRSYMAYFDSRILGVTGSPDLVRRAAESFKVRFEKVPAPDGGGEGYSLDHSAGMYLLAPGGAFVARFPYGTPAADIVERIGTEMRQVAAAEAAAAAEEAKAAAQAGEKK